MMGTMIRVLGTGGTIAGTAEAGAAENAYRAGQVAIEDLLRPLLPGLGVAVSEVQAVQVALIDSRDMSATVWQQLAAELQAGLDDPQVQGQVVTHGTDTLEETAVFLNGVLRGDKPVVLTAAMRPATSAQADGPANLQRALHLAASPKARGVLMAFCGLAWPAVRVRKVHPFALMAFSAGDSEPVARWDDGAQEWVWTDDGAVVKCQMSGQQSPVTMPADVSQWPRVEIVHSHAGASGDALRALLAPSSSAAPVRGVVVSSTGNGSIHHSIDQALRDAIGSGRLRREDVLVATRCTQGWVVGDPDHGWPVAHTLTPAQARVHLVLDIVRRAAPAQ
jgi:L-asparaginase